MQASSREGGMEIKNTTESSEPHSGRERDTSELELFTLMVLFALIFGSPFWRERASGSLCRVNHRHCVDDVNVCMCVCVLCKHRATPSFSSQKLFSFDTVLVCWHYILLLLGFLHVGDIVHKIGEKVADTKQTRAFFPLLLQQRTQTHTN